MTANVHAALRSRAARHVLFLLWTQPLASEPLRPRFATGCLIACTKFPDTEQLAPNVQIVFEVLSPTSGQTDRIEKVRRVCHSPVDTPVYHP